MKLNTQKINSALLEHNLNQSSLATHLNVSREAVSQWLRGTSAPRSNNLLKISKFLHLPYNDLLVDEAAPVIEFRKKGNHQIDEPKEQKALAQANLIELLSHHLTLEKISEFSTFVEPRLDYKYVQEAAGIVRSKLKIDAEGVVEWSSIFELFRDSRITFVPVLWGSKHYKNGLHFNIPSTATNWIFINLDTSVLDFVFMVCHELGHAKSPGLTKEQAEQFSDGFAGALLYPWSIAEAFYEKLKGENEGAAINLFKIEARKFKISPITIFTEVNKYAIHNKLPPIDLKIYAASTNLSKELGPLSNYIFTDSEVVTVSEYIEKSSSVFHSCFFDCLRSFLLSDEASGKSDKLKFVAGVLDLTLGDAEEIILELTGGSN